MKISDAEVQALYDKLAASPKAHSRFPLKIVDDNPSFATVDWGFRITQIGRNLIDLMPSKGALAAVIGHELTHNDPFEDMLAGNSRNLVEMLADREGLELAVEAGEAQPCDGEAAISALAQWEHETRGWVSPSINLRQQELENVCALAK